MRKIVFILLIELFSILAANLISLIAVGELFSARMDIAIFFASMWSIQLSGWMHREE